MLALSWVAGLLHRRPGRIAGAAAGVALAVGLLGSLGAFLAGAKASMTRRAVAGVGVDWQVEAQSGADATPVLTAVRRDPHVRAVAPVWFADSPGFEASVGGTTQTTGPGQVLGLPPGYARLFPGTVRLLTGAGTGVLLAQQTAANLHAGPGDTVNVGRGGLAAAPVRVVGVVELPQADSLFQKVGAPQGAQPQAPPDNVVLLPASRWHALFDPISTNRPELVRFQAHARLDHRLPHDPARAFSTVSGAAHHVEADVAGAALVGNNLAAALDAARSDALYAQVLFVVLGLPGAVLAGLLTRAVATAGGARRARELSLLRARGASVATLQRIATAEAAVVAAMGGVVGLGVAAATGRAAFGSVTFGNSTVVAVTWAGAAVAVGALISVAAVALPARRQARSTTVVFGRAPVGRPGRPLVLRWGLDLVVLAAAALVFWVTSRGGYKLVLAPEGVPTVSVSYWALAGPLLLWAGAGLFGWRIADGLLGSGLLRTAVRPLAGRLSGPVASSLRRQRGALSSSIVLVALSGTFAVSTAVFNTTYRHQVGVDAVLTNGADVTVTAPPATPVPSRLVARVEKVPGVRHVEPLQHRFVYIGPDLQDLYGVDTRTITSAARLQDAYFSGGSARDLVATLARQPDAALLSAETVQDFQLHQGDRLALRVRDGRTGALREVRVRYAGIVKEFPTAPTDSFVVANASYIAARTGDPSATTLLVDTSGSSRRAVAARVRHVLGTSAAVTDLDTSRRVVGSSLTAVDLAGLTRVELGYALVLTAAAAGLVLGLGLTERRRSFAIAAALGAKPRQVGSFIRSEALVIAVVGLSLGGLGGWVLARMLVKVLTGVFDPPPAQLTVPWPYLVTLAAMAAAAIVSATEGTLRAARRPAIETLRDL